MTDDRRTLQTLLARQADAGVLRGMMGFVAERLAHGARTRRRRPRCQAETRAFARAGSSGWRSCASCAEAA